MYQTNVILILRGKMYMDIKIWSVKFSIVVTQYLTHIMMKQAETLESL